MLLLICIVLIIITSISLLLNPIFGISLLFISKPMIDTTFDQPIFGGIHLTEIIGVVVPLLLFGKMFFAGERETVARLPLKPIWVLYALEIGFFSSFIAYHQGLLMGANVFFRHINGFIGFYMLQAFFHQEKGKPLETLLLAMIVAGLFPIGVGVYQIFTGRVWTAAQAEGIIRYVGLYHDAFTVRAYAFQTILALLLYAALYGRRNILLKGAALVYGAVSAIVLFRAYSKAGILSLGLWAVVWIGLQRKVKSLIVLGAAGFLVGVYYVSEIIDQVARLFQKEIGAIHGKVEVSRTFAGRWYGWEGMIARWQEFGWVQKMFGSGEVATGSHNDYLQILFHGGVIGLLIYLVLLAAVGLKIMTNLWERVDPTGVAALMLFLMWLVDTIGLVPSAYPGYQWFVWGMIGLSLRLRAEETRATERPEPAVQTASSEKMQSGVLVIPSPAMVKRRFTNLLP